MMDIFILFLQAKQLHIVAERDFLSKWGKKKKQTNNQTTTKPQQI